MDASLGSEADDSSDGEEETQDFISEIFGEAREDPSPRGATTPVPSNTTTHGEDDSIIHLDGEDDEVGVPSTYKRRSGRRSPREEGESSSSTKLMMEMTRLKAVVE